MKSHAPNTALRRVHAWGAWLIAAAIVLYGLQHSLQMLCAFGGDMLAANWKVNLSNPQTTWIILLSALVLCAFVVPIVLYVRAIRALRAKAVFDAVHGPGNAYRVSGKPVLHFRDADEAVSHAWRHYAMHLTVLAGTVLAASVPMYLLLANDAELSFADRGIRSVEVLSLSALFALIVAVRIPLRRRVEKRIEDLVSPCPT